jgi:hypothetical protein
VRARGGARTVPWCADFARWVWDQAGFHVDGLNAAARSFKDQAYRYGGEHSTPHWGDAVVFHNVSGGDRGVVHHVAIVTAVGFQNQHITIVSGDVGGQESTNGSLSDQQALYAHTSKVRQDSLDAAPGTMFGNTEAIDGYISPVPKDQPLGSGGGGGGGSSGGGGGDKTWVRTFSAAPGRDSGGTLNAGRNYVFCKVWGNQVGTATAYNHWWLYTDMDTGGRDYVSAYYLSGQGNDSAQAANGADIPDC